MSDVVDVIWHGLRDSFLMAWEVWWALVLGFAISGIVQAGAAHIGAGVVRRRPQLPRRLADAVEGDHDRVPAGRVHRAVRQPLLRVAVRAPRAAGGGGDRERDRRAADRRAE